MNFPKNKKNKSHPNGIFIREVTFKREIGYGQNTQLSGYEEIKIYIENLNPNRGTYASLYNKFIVNNEKKLITKAELPIADFEETGFIGREDEIKNIIKILNGRSNIISIISEGGVGKTSLALRIAQLLCNSQPKKYDHIIWTTSKATELTNSGFEEIKGHIDSSEGIFHSINSYIGNNDSSSIGVIIDFFKNQKVLLIIDNLENILDDKIESFLEQFLDELPESESKILITSRLPVGKNERIFNLKPMTNIDAIKLMTRLDEIRGGEELTHYNKDDLSKYCDDLHNNPLWIKWFVQSVRNGIEPDIILDNKAEILDFCIKNVFTTLDEKCKLVLKVMLCNIGEHRKGILTYLSELDDIQEQLTMLLSKNLITKKITPNRISYDITELSKDYLNIIDIVTPSEREYFTRKYNNLKAFKEHNAAKVKNDAYSFDAFTIRDDNDIVLAKYLDEAIKYRKNYAKAKIYIDKAKQLDNKYFEIYKVEGIVHFVKKEYDLAEIAYYKAMQLNQESPVIRVFYAEIISKYKSENDEALQNLKIAEKISPNQYKICLEIARVNMYLFNFDESIKYFEQILQLDNLKEWEMIRLHNIIFDNYNRFAIFLKETRSSISSIIEQLASLKQKCEDFQSHYKIDDRQREILLKNSRLIHWIENEVSSKSYSNQDDIEIIKDLSIWIQNVENNVYELPEGSTKEKITISRNKTLSASNNSDIKIKRGDIKTATIKNVNTDHGIFITLEGIDGLIHNDQLSYMSCDKLIDKYCPGDKIQIEITYVDIANYRFNAIIAPTYKILDLYSCEIREILNSGVIVKSCDFNNGFLKKENMSYTLRNMFYNKTIEQNMQISAYILKITSGAIELSQNNIENIK